MQHLVLIGMFLFILSLILILIVVLRLRHAYMLWQERKAQASLVQHQEDNQDNSAKKGLLSRMLARIDEFDSLTPLIVTPSSLSEEIREFGGVVPSTSTTSTNSSPPAQRRVPGRLFLLPFTHSSAKRANAKLCHKGTKTGVPRGSSTNDTNLELTVSSTLRHIGTMPEVQVHEHSTTIPTSFSNNSVSGIKKGPFADLDLISIDRTSVSTLEGVIDSRRERPRPNYMKLNGLTLTNNSILPPISTINLPQDATSNRLPVNKFAAPSGGVAQKNCMRYDPVRAQLSSGLYSTKESSSIDSLTSSVSSPMDSSVFDSESLLDTTGSLVDLSDSLYMASESDTSDTRGNGRSYSLGTQRVHPFISNGHASNGEGGAANNNTGGSSSCAKGPNNFQISVDMDLPVGKRYRLHRIEEETENVDEGYFVALSATDESLTSCDMLDSERNFVRSLYAKHGRDINKNTRSPKGEGLI